MHTAILSLRNIERKNNIRLHRIGSNIIPNIGYYTIHVTTKVSNREKALSSSQKTGRNNEPEHCRLRCHR